MTLLPETAERVRELAASEPNLSSRAIASRLKLARTTVCKVLGGWQPGTYKNPGAVYNPTPQELYRATLAIQAGWSDEEREKRSVVKRKPVEITEAKVCELSSRPSGRFREDEYGAVNW